MESLLRLQVGPLPSAIFVRQPAESCIRPLRKLSIFYFLHASIHSIRSSRQASAFSTVASSQLGSALVARARAGGVSLLSADLAALTQVCEARPPLAARRPAALLGLSDPNAPTPYSRGR